MLSLKKLLADGRILRLTDSRDVARYSDKYLNYFVLCNGFFLPYGLFTLKEDPTAVDHPSDSSILPPDGPSYDGKMVLANTEPDGSVVLNTGHGQYAVDIDITYATDDLKSAAMRIIDDNVAGRTHAFIVAGDDPSTREYALGLRAGGWTFIRLHRGTWLEDDAPARDLMHNLSRHTLLM